MEENVYGVCSQEPNTEANWGRGEAPKVRPAAGRWDNVAVAAAAAGLEIKGKKEAEDCTKVKKKAAFGYIAIGNNEEKNLDRSVGINASIINMDP